MSLIIALTLTWAYCFRAGDILHAPPDVFLWSDHLAAEGDVYCSRHLACQFDVREFIRALQTHPRFRDTLGWWTGTWALPNTRYYRPLISLVFWFEYRLFGENFFHWASVGLAVHAINCALIAILAFMLTGNHAVSLLTGLVAGAKGVFGNDVSSVFPYWALNFVGHIDVFHAFFFLLALIAYVHWLRTDHGRWLGAAAATWGLALLVKEMALSLPLLMAVAMVDRRHWRPSLWRQGVAVGLSTCAGVVFYGFRWWALGGPGDAPILPHTAAEWLRQAGLTLFPSLTWPLLRGDWWFPALSLCVVAGAVIANCLWSRHRMAAVAAVLVAIGVGLSLAWIDKGSPVVVLSLFDSPLTTAQPRDFIGLCFLWWTAGLLVARRHQQPTWAIGLWGLVAAAPIIPVFKYIEAWWYYYLPNLLRGMTITFGVTSLIFDIKPHTNEYQKSKM